MNLLAPSVSSRCHVSWGLAVYQSFFIGYSTGCDWTGTTDAETWQCCSSESGSQCGIQEGHCSNDGDCFSHLKCGTGNCQDQNPLSDFPIGSNCCYDPIPSKMKKISKRLNLDSIMISPCKFTFIRSFFLLLFLYFLHKSFLNQILFNLRFACTISYCNYIWRWLSFVEKYKCFQY